MVPDPNRKKPLTGPMTRAEAVARLDDGRRLVVTVRLPFGQVVCSSFDRTSYGLLDLLEDHIIVGGYLVDMSYALVGSIPGDANEPTGYALIEVSATIDQEYTEE